MTNSQLSLPKDFDQESVLWQSELFRLCQVDSSGGIRRLSPALADLLGQHSSPPIDELPRMIHPEDRQEFMADFSRLTMEGTRLDRRPVRLVTPDGRIISVEVQAEVLDNGGSPESILLFWERTPEEAVGSWDAAGELESFQQVVRSFTASLFDPLAMLNMEGRIVHVNEQLKNLTGFRRVDLIGKPVAVLFEERTDRLHMAMIRFAKWMRTGKMQDRSSELLTSEGGWIPVTLSGSTIRSEAGALIGMLIVARDERQNALLSALEKKNQELEDAYQELKRVDKMKDDILSLVGHELRAPLANILGYAEFLFEWDLPEAEKKKFSRIIYDESHRLSRLVNDILDLSRMEAGRMPYIYHVDSINRVIENSVASLRGEAEKKGVAFELGLDDQLEPMEIDSDRIQQVTTNIIHNAIKFTGDGTLIRVWTQAVEDGVMVSVADQGPGINAAHTSRVFNKFEQVDDVKHHSLGAGLGMPIAKQIVEEGHEGRLWFESTGPGKGTTFKFTIPRRRRQ